MESQSSVEVPFWKRALDILCVVASAPAWLPLGLLIGVGIRIVSPGPIFFKQQRVGYRGRLFDCLKFRSMAVNARPALHEGHLERLITSNRPMTKLDATGDPRLIPGGLLLRSLGLDELPQIINVLRGDMSLVGPRPCIPYEYEKFPPRYRQRCHTLPGLTGLWQISGKNRTTFEEMMELDLRYVATKSLLGDVKIMLLTLPAIFSQVRDVNQPKSSAGRGEVPCKAVASPPL